jgi:hypothetical protein
MSDIVYLYPKNSCKYHTCNYNQNAGIGIRSNLSVRGCNSVSEKFNCYDKIYLGKDVEPKDNNEIYALNPQVYTDKLAEGFDQLVCPKGQVPQYCSDKVFISRDPRQFNAPRAEYTLLDTIPVNGDVRLKNVYDKKYDDYGLFSKPYENIQDGQIMYYIDKSIQDPFYKPVFSEPAEQHGILFRDPMGAVKPEYNREPLINKDNKAVTKTKQYPYCLSYLQDTQSHREDLIALQQRKNNQEKWSSRWSTFN